MASMITWRRSTFVSEELNDESSFGQFCQVTRWCAPLALGALLVACQDTAKGSSFEREATFSRGVLKHQVFEPADIVLNPEQRTFVLASADLRARFKSS